MKCLRHVGRKWLNLNSFKDTLGTCSLLVQYKQHFTSMGLGYSLLTPGVDTTRMLWWVMVMGTTKNKEQPAEKEADFHAYTNFWNLVYYWTPGTDFATGYTFICAYKCRHSSCAHTCPFSGCQLQLAHASNHQVTSLRDPHQNTRNSQFLQKQNITSPLKKYPCKRTMCASEPTCLPLSRCQVTGTSPRSHCWCMTCDFHVPRLHVLLQEPMKAEASSIFLLF